MTVDPQGAMVTQAGTVIADRYLLRERIGAGSTGVVWRAVDTRLDRPVVVKVLAGDVEPPPRSTALRDGFNLTWEAAKGQEFSIVSDSCGSAYEEQATSNPTPAYGVGARLTFGETGHVVVFMDGNGATPPVVRTC